MSYEVKSDSKNDDHMVVSIEAGPDIVVYDAVWGEIKEGGTNYRSLGWYVEPALTD